MSELLIGCGSARDKRIVINNRRDWQCLMTLDHEPRHKPDVTHDLEDFPYPFLDESFDEIHAYEVLEHTGRQGDWRFFFAQWSEFYRILRPKGVFCATVPAVHSKWVWGDPSHTRIVTLEQLHFLDQRIYEHVGKSPTSDFRSVWSGNFQLIHDRIEGESQIFVLRKV